MEITAISDLHGFCPKLPGGDLLILAGDYTYSNAIPQWVSFFNWLKHQQYRKKILIAGNHDGFLRSTYPTCDADLKSLIEVQEFLDEIGEWESPDFEYLCDSGTEFEGVKFWGTPWTPIFERVNPKCASFMESEEFLNNKFAMIPLGTDILISHGPMIHTLDTDLYGYACGSSSLRDHVDRVNPKMHLFGHIHEQGGNSFRYGRAVSNTWCLNCSYVNEKYKPFDKPIQAIEYVH